MAEETKVIENTDNHEDKAPTVEELLAELAKAKAETNRYKASLDKASSEAADWKKKLRARQSAEEQAAADQAEAEKAKDELIKSLQRKSDLHDAKERYMDLGMDAELAAKTAEAELDGDRDTVAANFKLYQNKVIEAKQAEWLKSRPQINSGENGAKSEDELMLEAFDAAFDS